MVTEMKPSEEQILKVVDFAGLDLSADRQLVYNALKAKECNVESVIMQYFDSMEEFRKRFSVKGEAFENNSTTGVFHVESARKDEMPPGVTPPPDGSRTASPSRPPSRSNDSSALGRVGRLADWSINGDAAGTTAQYVQEDADMQRALQESAKEVGVALPLQESGVVDLSMSTPFGPAVRPEYDTDSWAMVPTQTRLAVAPAPHLRKRTAGAPAFLIQGRSSVGDHCLAGLITILHAIPLARNILLQLGSPAPSYGFHTEWWNGREILQPEQLTKLRSGSSVWGRDLCIAPDAMEEIHRLVAFLDSTDRSYSNVSVLADLVPLKNVSPEKHLLEFLAMHEGDLTKPLSQVVALANVYDDEPAQESAYFGLLEMENQRKDFANIKTIYEAVDHVMWNDVLVWAEVHSDSKMAMFFDTGDIFSFQISGEGPGHPLAIPEYLYPERWLASRKDEARKIQQGWCDTKRAMQQVLKRKRVVTEWHNDWNQKLEDAASMLESATKNMVGFIKGLQGAARFRAMREARFDPAKYPDYRAAPCQLNAQERDLHDILELGCEKASEMLRKIEREIQELDEKILDLERKQRFLGALLTKPNKRGRPKPMTCKEYKLRGIATPCNIVYLCQRTQPKPDGLSEHDAALGDQWWKLAYDCTNEVPVQAEEYDFKRASEEVWQKTKNPLLIYATVEAMSTPRSPLSPALQRFVRMDNKAFEAELGTAEEAQDPTRSQSGFTGSLSPSKRKHRSDSLGSMDSKRASMGSAKSDSPHETPLEEWQEEAAAMAMDGAQQPLGSYETIEGVEPEADELASFQEQFRRRNNSLAPGASGPDALAGPSPYDRQIEAELCRDPRLSGGTCDTTNMAAQKAGASVADAPARAPEMEERRRGPSFFTAKPRTGSS